MFYRFIMFLCRLHCKIWYHIDMEGLENIPKTGGYVYVCNHRSYLDPVLVAMMCSQCKFVYFAKKELFEKKLFAWLITAMGAFPVERGAGDMSAIQYSIDCVKGGKNLLIFPEGTRSLTGKVGRGKSGAALIAAKANADVVPVGITFEGKLHFRSPIKLRFGKIIPASEMQLSDFENIPPRELKALRIRMMDSIKALVDEPEEIIETEKAAETPKEKSE